MLLEYYFYFEILDELISELVGLKEKSGVQIVLVMWSKGYGIGIR